MNFEVDDNDIAGSFDHLAKALLLGHAILVNTTVVEITEIEFYFFKKGVHEDNYTHPHKYPSGHWRFHRQGLDITFQGTDDQDGGILIRGVKIGERHFNGPINALTAIFEHMEPVSATNEIILSAVEIPSTEIFRTHRHLPNKEKHEFLFHKYRYLKSFRIPDITKTSIKMGIEPEFDKLGF